MTTTDPFTTAAQIIDQHRSTGRWVGNGVRVECACGHESPGEHPGGPQTDEDNAHRDADRKHAQHVADMLAAQEPTSAEVQAFQDHLYERTGTWVPGIEVRAALSAARRARGEDPTR